MSTSVAVSPEPGEIELILNTVDEFCRDVIEPAFQVHEKILLPEAISPLIARIDELGLFAGREKTGLELWAYPEAPACVSLSLHILERLAHANAGFALTVHLHALAAGLSETFSPAADELNIPILQGRNGLAKTALARYLQGAGLSTPEHLLLKEYFPGTSGSGLPVYFHAPAKWQAVLFPTLSDTNELRWMRIARSDLEAVQVLHAHGLNELPLWRAGRFPEKACIPLKTEKNSKTLFSQLLGLSALATVAIGLGAVRHAHRIALNYARDRMQGGKAIIDHAAVQLMLGTISAHIGSVENMLYAVATDRTAHLHRIFQCRAVALPLLCEAATSAVQVLGGYGYMQDMGVEKILRDCNQLKLMFGTPDDLKLFLAVQESAL